MKIIESLVLDSFLNCSFNFFQGSNQSCIQMEAITHWRPQVIPEPLKSILPHQIPRICMVMEYPVPSDQ